MSTYIHGIAASENIDSSGERIIIAGLDISSLAVDGIFNYEHKSDNPGQIVGKVLKARKIFSDADCEDDHQLYFWNKCKVPYLYVMGELFDDYKDSAKEVAGIFRYDADKKGKNERNVGNFSIEGAKIDKQGMDIMRSIARKVTITSLPCNKAAIAEMVAVDQKKSKNTNVDELFKTESIEIELFTINKHDKLIDILKKEDPTKHANKLGIEPMAKENGLEMNGASSGLSGGAPTSPSLAMAEKPALAGGPGKILGTTKSGKAVHSAGRIHEYKGFSAQDHRDAAKLHLASGGGAKSSLHIQAANSADKRQQKLKGLSSGKSLHTVSAKSSPSATKLFDPDMSGKMKPPGIKKAIEAGSSMAAPGQLSGGAALSMESISSGITNNTDEDKKRKKYKRIVEISGFPKSKWLMRAEEEYAKWGKREQFETFMAKRLPHLTKGEIQAIGQTMALNKAMALEKALNNLNKFKK